MAYYAHTIEITMKYPADTVTRANGGFKKEDTEVVGRWVERSGAGKDVAILVGDGKKPCGVITRLTAAGPAVAIGAIVQGKRSTDAATAEGSRITGALRQESASGSPEPGFVTHMTTTSPSIVNLRDSCGYVLNGGSVVSTNTEAADDLEVLMWN